MSPDVQSRDDTRIGGGRDESVLNCIPARKIERGILIASL
jgi:hypothetical protein